MSLVKCMAYSMKDDRDGTGLDTIHVQGDWGVSSSSASCNQPHLRITEGFRVEGTLTSPVNCDTHTPCAAGLLTAV